jgi:AraC family transcriptional regulator
VSQPIEFQSLQIDEGSERDAGSTSLHENARTRRTRLLDSSVALVENLHCRPLPEGRTAEDFSPEFQVCFPYRGLFVWHVGGDEVVGDANQVLFVSGGESYHLSQPISGEYGELIITPDPQILAEIADASETRLAFHPLFRLRSRRADAVLQRTRAGFLHLAQRGAWDGVVAEELVIRMLRLALGCEPIAGSGRSGSTRRLIRQTKEYLEAHLSSSVRLADVALAVGASPAYLTDVFRRTEGVPLHRYLVQLRLARALVELPHAGDLTMLALDLGFSSHSHFTATFRRAFGCTPSKFRRSGAH